MLAHLLDEMSALQLDPLGVDSDQVVGGKLVFRRVKFLCLEDVARS